MSEGKSLVVTAFVCLIGGTSFCIFLAKFFFPWLIRMVQP